MALKTSVLPFPASAFFPRGLTSSAHLAHIWTQIGLRAHQVEWYNDDEEENVSEDILVDNDDDNDDEEVDFSEDILVDRQNVPSKAKESEDNRNVTSK